MPGVARGIKKNLEEKKFIEPLLPPGHAWVLSKNVSPFGQAIWPAIADIYMSEELYYIEMSEDLHYIDRRCLVQNSFK